MRMREVESERQNEVSTFGGGAYIGLLKGIFVASSPPSRSTLFGLL